MTRTLPCVLMFVLVMAAGPAAHQLDEYLQAARVSFERDRVALELDLTPGANVAGEIVGALDRNGDGVVQPLEARAYGEAVIGDVDLMFDGHPLHLVLETIEVPAVADMQRGVGTMQLTAVAVLDGSPAGTSHLRLANRHHPATSVYLANALVPSDRGVRVIRQRRDRQQQELDVEYTIAPRWSLHLLWVLFGAALVVSRIAARRV